jgi:ubiquinone biosynthesis protein
MEHRALTQSPIVRSSSAQQARRAKSSSPFDGMRALLRVIDAMLSAIESTVWDLRQAAEDFARAARHDATEARYGLDDATSRLARLTSTGAALSLIAGSYRLQVTKAAFLPRRHAERSLEALHQKNAERFRIVAEKHGGALLKVGQLLSARPDILPRAYVTELSILQDAAPRVPFEQARVVLEDELGGTIAELFTSFDETPIAAASIGQVHKAVLASGLEVAVKIQRPGIAPLVAQDLDLLELFLEAIAPLLPPTDLPTIARAVRTSVERELDFEAEAADASFVADALVDVEGLIVPRPVLERSSGRVLTTEFVYGRKITDELDALALLIADGDEVAASRRDAILGTLLEAYIRQILEVGTFQADPHPGNLLVKEDGTLVLLDFGSTQKLDAQTRRRYLELVMSFVAQDAEGVARACAALGFRTRSGRPETLQQFAEMLLGSFAIRAGTANFPTPDELMNEARALLESATNDPVDVLPEEFIMIARVFGTLAGMFLQYRPAIDVSSRVMPVLLRAMAS